MVTEYSREKEIKLVPRTKDYPRVSRIGDIMDTDGCGGKEALLVVAVQGFGGFDWAAYVENCYVWKRVEASDNPNIMEELEKQIIGYGTKLPQEEAEKIFPDWAKRYEYRR